MYSDSLPYDYVFDHAVSPALIHPDLAQSPDGGCALT